MNDLWKLVLFFGFIILIIYSTVVMYKDCSDKGGILVRGAFKYECVKSMEKL